MRVVKKALVATAIAAALVGIGAAPANAGITWGSCFGGYAGKSTYGSSGLAYANTARSGSVCQSYVGVALRYQSGSGSRVNSTTSTVVETSRYAAITGGYHYDTSTSAHPSNVNQ